MKMISRSPMKLILERVIVCVEGGGVLRAID